MSLEALPSIAWDIRHDVGNSRWGRAGVYAVPLPAGEPFLLSMRLPGIGAHEWHTLVARSL